MHFYCTYFVFFSLFFLFYSSFEFSLRCSGHRKYPSERILYPVLKWYSHLFWTQFFFSFNFAFFICEILFIYLISSSNESNEIKLSKKSGSSKSVNFCIAISFWLRNFHSARMASKRKSREIKTHFEEQTNDNNVVICHRIECDAIVLQKSSLIATSATKQSQTQSAYS